MTKHPTARATRDCNLPPTRRARVPLLCSGVDGWKASLPGQRGRAGKWIACTIAGSKTVATNVPQRPPTGRARVPLLCSGVDGWTGSMRVGRRAERTKLAGQVASGGFVAVGVPLEQRRGTRTREVRGSAMLLILASLALSWLVGCSRAPEAVAPSPESTESSDADPIRPTPVASRKGAVKKESPGGHDRRPPAPAADELTFADLSFDLPWFEPQSQPDYRKQGPFKRDVVPATAEKRAGDHVTITGYVMPASVFKQTGNEAFVLTATTDERNLFSLPPISETVLVRMLPNTFMDFTSDTIEVEGVFNIEELRDGDGDVICIYHLRDAIVRRPRSRSATLR
jgi:hypothetical protein